MLPLGFASGLPLALTSGTLQAWLTVAEVDIRTIGLFTLAGLPYTLKFLWAPLVDRFAPPWLGRRRGWIAVFQMALIGGIAVMAAGGPSETADGAEGQWAWTGLWLFGLSALCVAFLSASQDIAFDAYRSDLLKPQERGFGAAVSVTGYRLAMLVSGAGALIVAERIGWQETYLCLAGLMAVGIVTLVLSPDPTEAPPPPRDLRQAVWGPVREFFSAHPAGAGLLALIVLYKLGDAFAGALTTAFLIRGLGFTPTDVGIVNKGMGLAATIAGALFGGALMAKLGLFRSLLTFGLLQALSNFGFLALVWVGHHYPAMVAAVAVENLAGGMGTAAFVALLMSLCDPRYSATQFATLSALAAVGRVFVGPVSGLAVDAIGWGPFFALTVLVACPGLWLLWLMRASIERPPAVSREGNEGN